jgi:hypothetical protein
MRYLYGDAEEFPEEYNFLDTLQAFVECAGRAARLEHEIVALEEALAKSATDESRRMEVMTRFFEAAIAEIRSQIPKASEPALVEPHAEDLVAAVEAKRAEVEERHDQESRARRGQTEAEIDERREAIRACLGEFLTRATLAVRSSAFGMTLVNDAVSLWGRADHDGGITTAFDLDPQRSGFWSTPPKIGTITPALTVQVGMRKKFLSKTLAPELVELDEHAVTSVELTPSSCEVHTRGRAGSHGEALVFKLIRTESETIATIVVDGEARPAEDEDVPKLEALWQALADKSREALPHRRSLRWVKLDGDDVLENGLLGAFVKRLVDQFSPLAAEIARRSPNRAELSLKIDRGDGRREEIYVRKEDLARPLLELPEPVRARFTPLSIFPDARA